MTKHLVNMDMLKASRLEAAFNILRQNQVICRHNYWCCQSCGFSALTQKIERMEESGKRVRGVVFYHKQDSERLRSGNMIYLSFDGNGDVDQTAMGREIVAALLQAGYSETDVVWHGDPHARIELHNVLAE